MKMSFALRYPVRSKSETLRKHKKTSKIKKGVKPWDDSVQDLTKFKPSREDLERNHQLHLPKKDHERLFHNTHPISSFLQDEKENHNIFQDAPKILEKKRALIKERFYNQEKELREVLSETDRTMANVQDMFGDDVQRYRVFPHVTRAPTKKQNTESFLTSYDKSSNNEGTVNMELNAVSDEESNSSTQSAKHSFTSEINLDRYRKFLKESDTNKWEEEASSVFQSLSKNIPTNNENSCTDDKSIQHIVNQQHSNKNQKEHHSVKQSELIKNNVSHNQLSKSCDEQRHPSSQSFNDMKKLLDMLELEISEYEKVSGQNIKSDPIKIPSTLTGYTANLLSAVIRITRYLKESEVQLRAEMLMRKEIVDALEEQRDLIDALTADLIETQEKNEELKKMIYEQNKTNQKQHFQLSNDFHRLEQKLDSFLMLFDDIFEKVDSSETDHLDVSRDPKDSVNNDASKNNEISPKISPIHF
nr:unnamed protein product [Hydra vulgaris]